MMQEAMPHARTEISQHAPRMMTFKINPEKIRDVIGKGGAVIRALTEETGTTIDIQDDGMVTIASVNADACNAAKKRIEDITADVEVGRIYEGTVLRLLDFGAIVQVLPGKDGLLHISQIAKERVNQVSDYVKEGQVVRVKVLEADDKGRAAAVDEGRRGRRRSTRPAATRRACGGAVGANAGGVTAPRMRMKGRLRAPFFIGGGLGAAPMPRAKASRQGGRMMTKTGAPRPCCNTEIAHDGSIHPHRARHLRPDRSPGRATLWGAQTQRSLAAFSHLDGEDAARAHPRAADRQAQRRRR